MIRLGEEVFVCPVTHGDSHEGVLQEGCEGALGEIGKKERSAGWVMGEMCREQGPLDCFREALFSREGICKGAPCPYGGGDIK